MNDSEKKKKIVAAFFGVVLVGVLVYQVFLAGPKPPPKAPKDDKKTAATAKTPAGAKTAAAKSATASKGTAAGAASPAASGLDIVGIDFDVLLEQLLTKIEVVDFDYSAEKIARDPMRPLVGQLTGEGGAEGVDALNQMLVPGQPSSRFMKEVNAISYNDTNPVAVVDGEVVYIGYQYPNGVTVQSIGRDKVVFKQGDVEIPVELKEH